MKINKLVADLDTNDSHNMSNILQFAQRTNWPLTPNKFSIDCERLRNAKVPILDLTESNPTCCNFTYLKGRGVSPTPHPDERSEEGSHEILQPFGLQDEQSERNTKDIATAQLNSAESVASAA